MKTLRLYSTIAVGGLMILSAQGAAAAEWKLVEVAGPVRIATPGRDPWVATLGQVLPTGSNVTTGAGGRAALMNGAQRVVVGPNSRMTVAPESNAGMTRVMQDLGSILFQVDKKPSQHFRVETPLLAAVVKGTTFTVTVGPQSDAVHVAEGLVEVRAGSGGAMQDVPAGATGVVTREDPQALNVKTPTSDVSAEPVPAAIAPLDYASASGGLVESAPVAGAAPALQAAQSERRGSDIAASGDGGGATEPGQGLQAARAEAAVIALAPDNPTAGGGSGGGGGNSGNGGVNPGNSNPGNGNGGGDGNAGGGQGQPGNNGNGNGGGAPPGANNPGHGAGNGNADAGQGQSGNNGNGNGGGATPGANNPGHGNGNGNADTGQGQSGNNGNGNGGGATPGANNPGHGNGNGNGNADTGQGQSGNSGNGNGGVTPGANNPGHGNGNGNTGDGQAQPGNNGNGGGGATPGADNPGNGNGGGQGGGNAGDGQGQPGNGGNGNGGNGGGGNGGGGSGGATDPGAGNGDGGNGNGNGRDR